MFKHPDMKTKPDNVTQDTIIMEWLVLLDSYYCKEMNQNLLKTK